MLAAAAAAVRGLRVLAPVVALGQAKVAEGLVSAVLVAEGLVSAAQVAEGLVSVAQVAEGLVSAVLVVEDSAMVVTG